MQVRNDDTSDVQYNLFIFLSKALFAQFQFDGSQLFNDRFLYMWEGGGYKVGRGVETKHIGTLKKSCFESFYVAFFLKFVLKKEKPLEISTDGVGRRM